MSEVTGARTLRIQRAVNAVVRAVLRIPGLNLLAGARLVTLYVVGRKTGRTYAVPVAYLRDGDQLLVGTSFAWARNLRTGDRLAVRLRGRRRWMDVRVATGEDDVVAAYARMSSTNSAFAKFNEIRFDAAGEPDSNDLHRAWAAGARVLTLSPAAA